MSAETIARIASLHRYGRLKPSALVIGGETFALHDLGCCTCLTSWPCPTVRVIEEAQAPEGEVSSGQSSPAHAVEHATPRPPVPIHPDTDPSG